MYAAGAFIQMPYEKVKEQVVSQLHSRLDANKVSDKS